MFYFPEFTVIKENYHQYEIQSIEDEDNISCKGTTNADVEYNIKYPTLLHNELHFTEYVVPSDDKRVLEA